MSPCAVAISGWLSLLIVLAVAGERDAKGYQESANTPVMKATVKFDLYRDYLIVAPGKAGKWKGLNLLIDTGASPTLLDRQLAQKLGLEEEPASITLVNGKMAAGRATLPSLELGPMRRDNLPVMVEDLSFFQKALPVRIDAVIGLDVLGSAFEIDYLVTQDSLRPASPMAEFPSLAPRGRTAGGRCPAQPCLATSISRHRCFVAHPL